MRFNIYENGKKINTIISTEEFCKNYCDTNQYTYNTVEEIRTKPQDKAINRDDDIDAILVDQEYRLTLLELGVNE